MATQLLKQKTPYYLISLGVNRVLLPCDGRRYYTLTGINLEETYYTHYSKYYWANCYCQAALIIWRLAIWAKSSDTGSTFASGGH